MQYEKRKNFKIYRNKVKLWEYVQKCALCGHEFAHILPLVKDTGKEYNQ